MLGNVEWYSERRKKIVRIGINGGKVCYDPWEHGFNEVPDHLRRSVLAAGALYREALETIFWNDVNVEDV